MPNHTMNFDGTSYASTETNAPGDRNLFLADNELVGNHELVNQDINQFSEYSSEVEENTTGNSATANGLVNDTNELGLTPLLYEDLISNSDDAIAYESLSEEQKLELGDDIKLLVEKEVDGENSDNLFVRLNEKWGKALIFGIFGVRASTSNLMTGEDAKPFNEAFTISIFNSFKDMALGLLLTDTGNPEQPNEKIEALDKLLVKTLEGFQNAGINVANMAVVNAIGVELQKPNSKLSQFAANFGLDKINVENPANWQVFGVLLSFLLIPGNLAKEHIEDTNMLGLEDRSAAEQWAANLIMEATNLGVSSAVALKMAPKAVDLTIAITNALKSVSPQNIPVLTQAVQKLSPYVKFQKIASPSNADLRQVAFNMAIQILMATATRDGINAIADGKKNDSADDLAIGVMNLITSNLSSGGSSAAASVGTATSATSAVGRFFGAAKNALPYGLKALNVVGNAALAYSLTETYIENKEEIVGWLVLKDMKMKGASEQEIFDAKVGLGLEDKPNPVYEITEKDLVREKIHYIREAAKQGVLFERPEVDAILEKGEELGIGISSAEEFIDREYEAYNLVGQINNISQQIANGHFANSNEDHQQIMTYIDDLAQFSQSRRDNGQADYVGVETINHLNKLQMNARLNSQLAHYSELIQSSPLSDSDLSNLNNIINDAESQGTITTEQADVYRSTVYSWTQYWGSSGL